MSETEQDKLTAGASEAAQLDAGFEGWSPVPYLDTIAKPPVWTTGFGSTHWFDGTPITQNTRTITRDEGISLMTLELKKCLEAVASDVRVPISSNMYAALADFAYNVGRGALGGSTLLRLLNNGDYEGAANEFAKWDHAGGREIAGLLRRRLAEKALFTTPDQVAGVQLNDGVVSTATLTATENTA